MEEFLYLAGGVLLLVLTLYDFFYTTLSGSGAAFISKTWGFVTHQLMLFLESSISSKVFKFSGMVVNLSILTVSVLLVWQGLFLVFSYNPEAITNSSGSVASGVERLYYTGYVLSILGMGNFKSTSPFFWDGDQSVFIIRIRFLFHFNDLPAFILLCCNTKALPCFIC